MPGTETCPHFLAFFFFFLRNQDLGVDAVGSLGADSEGKGRDEADMQGHRCWLQLPARAAGAHLEHTRGAK